MTNGWLGFGIPTPIHVPIPPELSSKTALLSYLGVSQAELKKIWYHREKMYHCFDVAKKSGKPRLINAPDRRLKFLSAGSLICSTNCTRFAIRSTATFKGNR